MLHLNFTPFPTLITPRLQLRAINMADADNFYLLRTDEATNQYTGISKPASVDDVKQLIQKLIDNTNNNEAIFWVLTTKDADQFIGTFCIWNINKETATGELGYALLPAYWGKGYMQEAIEAVLNFGFQTMKLQTIEAYTHYNNLASIKLLQKNHFTLNPHKKAEDNENLIVYSRTH